MNSLSMYCYEDNDNQILKWQYKQETAYLHVMQFTAFAKWFSEKICMHILGWEWSSEVRCRHWLGLNRNSHYGSLQMSSDCWFVAGIHTTVKLQAARSTAPVYLYQFSFDGELGFMKRIVGAYRFPGESVTSDQTGSH
jgi:hypothetical protein